LSVQDYSDTGLLLRNHVEPPFEGTFTVAEQPPPFVSTHGDVIFELHSA